jgi:fimbrial isopeptide formation D2 family protein/LPXTG-motif cell wall-anchored protein
METMKRMKKILTGLLTLAMTLSMMTMTAFAAEPSEKMPTIKTGETGTVTIHKYTKGTAEGTTGTGKVETSLPTGAEPLKGAGFTLYKVVNEAGMEAYYNANPTSLPAVDTYVNSDGTIKSEYASGATAQVITDNNGTATFSNLELGFYVVIETTVPDAVTTPMKPFLLSVPMTTTDGSDWLYDIHVYPKNETGYGKISLEKTGVKGEKILGAEFALQKKSDTTSSWINITQKSTAQGDNTGDALILTTDVNGLITIDGLSKGEYRLIETSVGNGYIMDGATAYEFTVNSDKTITYKESTDANITINVTNERPDLTKEVQKKNDGAWGRDADYSFGDKIPYKITVNVPNNITKLKTFTVTDTPINLTDDLASIEIKCNDVDVETTAYTTSATTEDGFTIAFTPANMTNYAGKTLVITYNATLKDTAYNTTAGNQNTAKLEYSKNITPNATTDPDNPNKEKKEGKNTIENSAVVYTFAVKIEKTGVDGTETKKLANVEFDLYQEVPAGTAGAISGADAPAGLDKTKSWKKIKTLKTGTDGTVTHKGLSNGTYYLVETKTEKEYNLLKNPIKVTLSVQYTITQSTTSSWVEDGNGQKQEKSKIETTTFTGSDNATEGIKVQEVINKKGFTLPTTGGIGTFVFTFAGIAMMAAAVILLITGKKKKAE